MGLDMYLFKKRKNAGEDEEPTEIAYWRKANQIREWFVNNVPGVDNCKAVLVTKEQLEDLRDTCLAVLFDRKNANAMLPTSSGFFFGDTDYDDWYFEQVTDTVDMLNEILQNTNWNNENVSYYEWW